MAPKPAPAPPAKPKPTGGFSNAGYNEHKDRAFSAVLATGDPGNLAWIERAGHRWPNRGGSENIAAEQHALELFRPETRARGLAAWSWWAERSRTAFEGIEYGSRIYRSRTLAAHLLAYRWAESVKGEDVFKIPMGAVRTGDLRAFLRDWLRLYWTLELLASVHLYHGVQSMRIGARSAGHPLHPVQSDYALALGLGEPFQWVKPWRYLGPQNKEGPGALARQLRALEPEIKASASQAVSLYRDSLAGFIRGAPAWGTLATTHYYKTDQGAAAWVEHQEGGNTVGIAAMGSNYQEEPWCIGPSPKAWAGKERAWRQKGYELWAEAHPNGLILASGRVAGAQLPGETHPLPAGGLLYHIVHGPSGLRRIA